MWSVKYRTKFTLAKVEASVTTVLNRGLDWTHWLLPCAEGHELTETNDTKYVIADDPYSFLSEIHLFFFRSDISHRWALSLMWSAAMHSSAQEWFRNTTAVTWCENTLLWQTKHEALNKLEREWKWLNKKWTQSRTHCCSSCTTGHFHTVKAAIVTSRRSDCQDSLADRFIIKMFEETWIKHRGRAFGRFSSITATSGEAVCVWLQRLLNCSFFQWSKRSFGSQPSEY